MNRPTITKNIIRQAAQKTAAETCNLDTEEQTRLATHLADIYHDGMNGYELARELERTFSWEYIDPMFVSDIDAMSCHVRTIHQNVCHTWVKEHNIQPPLPIGTQIKEGEITAVSDHMPAYYEVREPDQDDSKGISRRLIRFEDAVKQGA